ncbi:MAG: ABC transporter ATP-binding protein [Angelakisella sp.]|nr:ABC transporter ATP-binding protein [Angelakisella sp.]
MNILEIVNLQKSFGGQRIIDNLSMSVPEGSIFGFIGQNGSGKTTTMKMVLGLLRADGGSISVCGETVSYGAPTTNKDVGYLPDVPEFYNYMKPKEYLSLCGEISRLSRQETAERSEELLELVGLKGVNKRIGGFSRGMKQRLGIAQALLSRPKLLICDEPTSALDPVGRKEILDILHKIKGSTTVIFSTHILSDVERICDRVAVLHNGKIVVSGTLSEIKLLHKQNKLLLEFASDTDLQLFLKSSHFANAQTDGNSILLAGEDVAVLGQAVIANLNENNICPLKMEIAESSLENLFLEVVS